MTRVAATRSVLKVVMIGAVFHAMAAVSPAHACLLNSWCSSSYDPKYNSSECRYQRSCVEPSPYGTAPMPPRMSYGAIAFSPSSGDLGYSEQYGNRTQAERRARQECGKGDCEIAAWYYNSCGAVAADQNGSWGGAQGSSVQQAGQGALNRCRREGGTNCEIKFSRCSR